MKMKTLRDVMAVPIDSQAIRDFLRKVLHLATVDPIEYFMMKEIPSFRFSTGVSWSFTIKPLQEEIRVVTFLSIDGKEIPPVSMYLDSEDGERKKLAYELVPEGLMSRFVEMENEILSALEEPFRLPSNSYLVIGEIASKVDERKKFTIFHRAQVSALGYDHAIELGTPSGWFFVESPNVSVVEG